MKYILIILAIFILILVFLLIKRQSINKTYVLIDKIYFKAEIAKTDQQKETGLAKYRKIDNDFVMVFPFNDSDYYAFWMKDMKFSIDIIYVRNNKIVDIFSAVPPPKNENEALTIIRPKNKSDTILEINANLSNKYKFKNGDKVYINY